MPNYRTARPERQHQGMDCAQTFLKDKCSRPEFQNWVFGLRLVRFSFLRHNEFAASASRRNIAGYRKAAINRSRSCLR
jgi:hypothetical protein